jgi:hypothetical protein
MTTNAFSKEIKHELNTLDKQTMLFDSIVKNSAERIQSLEEKLELQNQRLQDLQLRTPGVPFGPTIVTPSSTTEASYSSEEFDLLIVTDILMSGTKDIEQKSNRLEMIRTKIPEIIKMVFGELYEEMVMIDFKHISMQKLCFVFGYRGRLSLYLKSLSAPNAFSESGIEKAFLIRHEFVQQIIDARRHSAYNQMNQPINPEINKNYTNLHFSNMLFNKLYDSRQEMNLEKGREPSVADEVDILYPRITLQQLKEEDDSFFASQNIKIEPIESTLESDQGSSPKLENGSEFCDAKQIPVYRKSKSLGNDFKKTCLTIEQFKQEFPNIGSRGDPNEISTYLKAISFYHLVAWRQIENIQTCLLYTSPSPRD